MPTMVARSAATTVQQTMPNCKWCKNLGTGQKWMQWMPLCFAVLTGSPCQQINLPLFYLISNFRFLFFFCFCTAAGEEKIWE